MSYWQWNGVGAWELYERSAGENRRVVASVHDERWFVWPDGDGDQVLTYFGEESTLPLAMETAVRTSVALGLVSAPPLLPQPNESASVVPS